MARLSHKGLLETLGDRCRLGGVLSHLPELPDVFSLAGIRRRAVRPRCNLQNEDRTGIPAFLDAYSGLGSVLSHVSVCGASGRGEMASGGSATVRAGSSTGILEGDTPSTLESPDRMVSPREQALVSRMARSVADRARHHRAWDSGPLASLTIAEGATGGRYRGAALGSRLRPSPRRDRQQSEHRVGRHRSLGATDVSRFGAAGHPAFVDRHANSAAPAAGPAPDRAHRHSRCRRPYQGPLYRGKLLYRVHDHARGGRTPRPSEGAYQGVTDHKAALRASLCRSADLRRRIRLRQLLHFRERGIDVPTGDSGQISATSGQGFAGGGSKSSSTRPTSTTSTARKRSSISAKRGSWPTWPRRCTCRKIAKPV